MCEPLCLRIIIVYDKKQSEEWRKHFERQYFINRTFRQSWLASSAIKSKQNRLNEKFSKHNKHFYFLHR